MIASIRIAFTILALGATAATATDLKKEQLDLKEEVMGKLSSGGAICGKLKQAKDNGNTHSLNKKCKVCQNKCAWGTWHKVDDYYCKQVKKYCEAPAAAPVAAPAAPVVDHYSEGNVTGVVGVAAPVAALKPCSSFEKKGKCPSGSAAKNGTCYNSKLRIVAHAMIVFRIFLCAGSLLTRIQVRACVGNREDGETLRCMWDRTTRTCVDLPAKNAFRE